jgi:hypothetical protein
MPHFLNLLKICRLFVSLFFHHFTDPIPSTVREPAAICVLPLARCEYIRGFEIWNISGVTNTSRIVYVHKSGLADALPTSRHGLFCLFPFASSFIRMHHPFCLFVHPFTSSLLFFVQTSCRPFVCSSHGETLYRAYDLMTSFFSLYPSCEFGLYMFILH